jgi:hypothetical protein
VGKMLTGIFRRLLTVCHMTFFFACCLNTVYLQNLWNYLEII